jgi:amicyanin
MKTIFKRYRKWGAICVLLVLGMSAKAATVTVTIANFAFSPSQVTINVGDTVTWVQQDTTRHDSDSNTGVWNGPLLNRGQMFSFTFNTAGTFGYHCDPHPFMTGTVTVRAAQNTPPTISITGPANGASFTAPASVTVTAVAADANGSVAQVEFFNGGTSLGIATAAPYSVTTTLDAGSHTFTARATDNAGATTTSEAVSVTVTAPNAAPTVTVTAPAAGASFFAPASFEIQADAADTDGSIATVEFLVGTEVVGTASAAPFKASVTGLAPGTYVVTARATDNAGASATSQAVSINVSEPPVATPPRLSGAMRAADGHFHFTIHGTAGRVYVIQASSDLAGPWTAIQTLTASADTFEFEEDFGAGPRFFRVVQQ